MRYSIMKQQNMDKAFAISLFRRIFNESKIYVCEDLHFRQD